MKILIIDLDYPLPIHNGRRIRTWNFIKSLAGNHELSLLFIDHLNMVPAENELKKYFKNTWMVSRKTLNILKGTSRLKRIIYSIKEVPWEIWWSFSSKFNKKFQEIILEHKFDFVLCRYIYTAQYLFVNKGIINCKTIVDLDDIETIKKRRFFTTEEFRSMNTYAKIRNLLNYIIFQRYHRKLRMADVCLVCSETDSAYVKKKGWCRNVEVVPNSVDVSSYKTVSDLTKEVLGQKIILFCGLLDYGPNVDGIKWFINSVFPLILLKEKEARLHIVGRSPTQKILAYGNNKSIFVFPDVPSVLPYYEQSSIVVVPIRFAGGTRIKILEAMACRRPVVSTTIGAEGLGVSHQKECLIADSKENFAEKCVELLNDFNQSKSLVEKGFDYLSNNYDNKVVSQKINQIFN
jgi:glycosyltransferase involved in cell wall biosynthesis